MPSTIAVRPRRRGPLHRHCRAWSPRHRKLVSLFRDEGAIAVLDDINQLEAVL